MIFEKRYKREFEFWILGDFGKTGEAQDSSLRTRDNELSRVRRFESEKFKIQTRAYTAFQKSS